MASRRELVGDAIEPLQVLHLAANVGHVPDRHRLDLGAGQAMSARKSEEVADLIEIGQERLTRLDRSLIARAKDGILLVSAAEEADPVQQTLRIGRLKTLERLELAKERQQGVWASTLEPKGSCGTSASGLTSSR